VVATNDLGDGPCQTIDAFTNGDPVELPNAVTAWKSSYRTSSIVVLVWDVPSSTNPVTGNPIPAIDQGYIVQ
jgi:hypothetical protein